MHYLSDIFTLQSCQLVQILKSTAFVTHLYLCESSHKDSTKICTEKEEKKISSGKYLFCTWNFSISTLSHIMPNSLSIRLLILDSAYSQTLVASMNKTPINKQAISI